MTLAHLKSMHHSKPLNIGGLLAVLLLSGCGGSANRPQDQPFDNLDTITVGSFEIELTAAGIERFVRTQRYQAWPSKQHQRNSSLNHKITRGYYHEALLQAVEIGQWPLPIGSLAFNEEDYSDSGQVEGYSLGVKIADGDAPDTWLWWQANIDDLGQPVVFATGHPECERCHSDGFDRILADTLPVR